MIGRKSAFTNPPVTPPEDQSPRIISEVSKGKSTESTISPDNHGTRDTGGYDENISPDTNAHEQFVAVNQVEVSPKSYKE